MMSFLGIFFQHSRREGGTEEEREGLRDGGMERWREGRKGGKV